MTQAINQDQCDLGALIKGENIGGTWKPKGGEDGLGELG